MDKDFLIKLCLGVYRVTEVFPDREPLKFDIRERANQILADLIGKEQKNKVFEQILANIEILQGYFELAKGQKWVDERNFFVLGKEYDKIEREIKKELTKKGSQPRTKKRNPSPIPFDNLRNERWKKILEVLSQKEKAQTWEIKKIFPEVTKRTLRRDLDYLLETGLIQRVGQGNDTYYKLGRTE